MIKGKTTSGFQFEVDENITDDMEFVDAMADWADNTYRQSTVLVKLLGNEQKKKLYEHVRDEETGRVSAKKIGQEMNEIFSEIASQSVAVKN